MGKIGINWQIGSVSGWGVLGLHIARHLLETRAFDPIPMRGLSVPDDALLPRHHGRLKSNAERFAALIGQAPSRTAQASFPVLHGLGNQLIGSRADTHVSGTDDLGIVFLEDTALTAAAVERGRRFARIAAGAAWTADVLRAAGLGHVEVCPQGIDPAVFHPGPPREQATDRFIVFSGGKLEHRKGQDIVIAAFRRFRDRHPEALLVASWFNPWPELVKGLQHSPWGTGVPGIAADGAVDVASWLRANGLPDESFRVVPPLLNTAMGGLMRQADAALFPNRCEGGTNLVAMEALACGVPTVLSANTGHLDLIADVPCYPLLEQGPVAPDAPGRGTEGWGESSIEEILDALERIHADRAQARVTGLRAAERMQEAWTWGGRIDRMLKGLALRID